MTIPRTVVNIFNLAPIKALCTSDNKGMPNVVPVSSVKITNNSILIVDSFLKKTKRNILLNPKTAMSFWQGAEGFQLKGRAKYYTQGKLFEKTKKWVLDLKPNKKIKGVIKITVEEIYFLNPTNKLAGKKYVHNSSQKNQ